jgi:glycosyltransferase involved in cell wall biosynthesis
VELLYSGIPLDHIPAADPLWIQRFRREQGRSPEDKVLGIAGRLESHKGHLDAFKALQLILETRSDAYLWIVGDGRYQDVLAQWVTANGMADRVRFLGYRSDVLQVIQCFDVQIFPSHQEGTPSTLFEAMAVGIAPVASTADGQGEILEDGKTALLFAPGDHAKMASQVLRVLQDDALRRTLQHNVRARIRDFDMNRTIATLEATYEAIMRSGRSPRI